MTVSTAPFGARHLALAHAVANDLAAAELHLLAIGGEILLDFDEKLGIGKPHLVAGSRPEHVGIGGAGDLVGHISGSLGGKNESLVGNAPQATKGNIKIDQPLLRSKRMTIPTGMAEAGDGDIVVGVAQKQLSDHDHTAARHDVRAGLMRPECLVDTLMNGLIDDHMALAGGIAESGELIGVIVAEIVEFRMRLRQRNA